MAVVFIDAVRSLSNSESESESESDSEYASTSSNTASSLSINEKEMPCLDAVCMSLSILLPDSSTATRLRKEFPDVVRACVKWLVAAPMGMHAQMEEGTFDSPPLCCCDKDHPIGRELHDPAPKDPLAREVRSLAMDLYIDDSPLETLLRSMMTVARSAFADVIADGPLKPLKRAQRARRRGMQPPWPSRMSDMIPEMETSLYALCMWEEWCDHAVLLELLHAIYVLCASPTFPSILLTTLIPLGWIPATIQAINAWKRGSRDASMRRRCGNIMIAAGELLKDFLALHKCQMAKLIHQADFDKWGKTANTACLASEVISELNDHEINQSRGEPNVYAGLAQTFRDFAVQLHHAIGSPADERRYGHAFLAASAQYTQAPADPLKDLAFFAPFLYRARLCANVDCPLIYVEWDEELRVCGGCGHTYYCSKRCQKEAWRAADVPHKGICTVLRTLMQAIPPPKLDGSGYVEDQMVFVQHCRNANVDMRLVSDIIDHFAVIYSR